MDHVMRKTWHKWLLAPYILLSGIYLLAFNTIGAKVLSWRIDQLFLIILILVQILIPFLFIKDLKFSPKSFKVSFVALLAFILLYTASAILYMVGKDIRSVFEVMPTILLVLPSFLSAFLLSQKTHKQDFLLKILFFIVFGASLIDYYLFVSYFESRDADFLAQSNNGGYSMLVLIPLGLYAFRGTKIIRILVPIVLSGLILYSSKRGAIIILGIVLSYIIFKTLGSASGLKKWILIIACFVAIYFATTRLNILELNFLQRFNQEGGSGRDIIYSSILDSIGSFSFGELLVGRGFYSVQEFLNRIFKIPLWAHNDWLQIAHDLGLLGLTSYTLLLLSLFYLYKWVNKRGKYEGFIIFACLLIWISKSLVSGVFMDKSCLVLIQTIGFCCGSIYSSARNTQMREEYSKRHYYWTNYA